MRHARRRYQEEDKPVARSRDQRAYVFAQSNRGFLRRAGTRGSRRQSMVVVVPTTEEVVIVQPAPSARHRATGSPPPSSIGEFSDDAVRPFARAW